MTYHESLTQTVVDLVEGAQKHMREFPETFDMSLFAGRTAVAPETPCGSIGCIAGEIVLIADGPRSGKISVGAWIASWNHIDVRDRAEVLLGINSQTGRTIWFVEDWPEECIPDHAWLYHADGECHDEPSYSLITVEDACGRLDHFLEFGE